MNRIILKTHLFGALYELLEEKSGKEMLAVRSTDNYSVINLIATFQLQSL